MISATWSFRLILLLFSVLLSLELSRVSASNSLKFPSNYQQNFTHYAAIACPNSQILRQIYANPIAINAAEENKPLPNGSVIDVEAKTNAL